MQIAILIHSYRLIITKYCRNRHILEIHTDTSVLCLYIYECNVMLRKHWVLYTADLNSESMLIKPYNCRDMLLETCIYCSRYQLFHLLTAADHRHLTVYNLLYNVTAMAASIKFH